MHEEFLVVRLFIFLLQGEGTCFYWNWDVEFEDSFFGGVSLYDRSDISSRVQGRGRGTEEVEWGKRREMGIGESTAASLVPGCLTRWLFSSLYRPPAGPRQLGSTGPIALHSPLCWVALSSWVSCWAAPWSP